MISKINDDFIFAGFHCSTAQPHKELDIQFCFLSGSWLNIPLQSTVMLYTTCTFVLEFISFQKSTQIFSSCPSLPKELHVHVQSLASPHLFRDYMSPHTIKVLLQLDAAENFTKYGTRFPENCARCLSRPEVWLGFIIVFVLSFLVI